MHNFKLLLLLVVLASVSGCRALFWRDSMNWAGGSWKGSDVFIEIQHSFQSKSSWYPLNQNAIVRDYKTTLLLHKIRGQGIIKTVPLSDYKGWTLNDALFLTDRMVFAIRGRGNSYGSWDRELIAVEFGTESKRPRTLLKPDMRLLLAVPSPDSAWLAVLLTKATRKNPTGKIFIDFYDISSGKFALRQRFPVAWSGAPGLPALAWAPDSSRLFINRDKEVVEASPGQKSITISRRFPKCFLITTSGKNISDSGVFFFRTVPDGKIQLKKTDEWLPFAKVPMTSKIKEIGAGCP